MDQSQSASSPQWSGESSSSSSSSPVHPTVNSASAVAASGISTVKRTNVNFRTAGQRLAQVMASRKPNDGEEGDNLEFQFAGPAELTTVSTNGSDKGGDLVARWIRSPSPAVHRQSGEHMPLPRSMWPVGLTLTPARQSVSVPPIEPLGRSSKSSTSCRITEEIGQLKARNMRDQHEVSAIHDELDMLQEENEVMLKKLRDAKERRNKAEARIRFLEKQVADIGEGLSVVQGTELVNRKEALCRKEDAIRAEELRMEETAMELAALQSNFKNLKEEASVTVEKHHKAESEVKALCSMTQTLFLTREQMEDVILKRCWLARYWGLAVQLGILADIAAPEFEYWSAFAPYPFEVVASAGQKAREEFRGKGSAIGPARNKASQDLADLSRDGNIEIMLSVEAGLLKLASLKIEDAVFHALSQNRRRRSLFHQSIAVSDFKQPGELKFMEAFDLSIEESEDVLFKEAWLSYFWRRAKEHGVEKGIAEERLQFWFWISRRGQSRTSRDAVDVERGMSELRKLRIEHQVWEASRRERRRSPPSAPNANPS